MERICQPKKFLSDGSVSLAFVIWLADIFANSIPNTLLPMSGKLSVNDKEYDQKNKEKLLTYYTNLGEIFVLVIPDMVYDFIAKLKSDKDKEFCIKLMNTGQQKAFERKQNLSQRELKLKKGLVNMKQRVRTLEQTASKAELALLRAEAEEKQLARMRTEMQQQDKTRGAEKAEETMKKATKETMLSKFMTFFTVSTTSTPVDEDFVLVGKTTSERMVESLDSVRVLNGMFLRLCRIDDYFTTEKLEKFDTNYDTALKYLKRLLQRYEQDTSKGDLLYSWLDTVFTADDSFAMLVHAVREHNLPMD